MEQDLINYGIRICSKESNVDTLAKYSCLLNTWKWPFINYGDLFEKMPSLNRVNHIDDKFSIVHPIIVFIENKIGKKAVSKYWNTKFRTDSSKMSWFQFEVWWLKKSISDL